MKIKEVEEVTGLTRANIRFYESKGLLTPERIENKYREYSKEDVEVLHKIVLFRKLGVSVEDIRLLLNGESSLQDTIGQTKEQLKKQIEELNGALNLCLIMEQRQENMKQLDVKEYLSMIDEQEKAGMRFVDLMKDIMEGYYEDVYKKTYYDMHIFRNVKGNRMLGIVCSLVVIGLIRVFLPVIILGEDFTDWKERFLWPFQVVLALFVLYSVPKLLQRKFPNNKFLQWDWWIIIPISVFLAMLLLIFYAFIRYKLLG